MSEQDILDRLNKLVDLNEKTEKSQKKINAKSDAESKVVMIFVLVTIAFIGGMILGYIQGHYSAYAQLADAGIITKASLLNPFF
jgi:hypothetical protein